MKLVPRLIVTTMLLIAGSLGLAAWTGDVAGSLAMAGGLMLAVLVTAAPIVARMRRLTADVRRSAGSGYTTPVPTSGNDEIAELAAAFNEAGVQMREQVATIEEREKTLRRFVANTTHDVMTPLTVLQGHLSSMKRAAERGAIDQALLVSALEESHYLASLVHNLGAVAKLEASGRHFVRYPVNLNTLVERVVARHRPIAQARRMAIEFAVPEATVEVGGDETLLEQALSNVVDNAVRHNNPGGHVAVTLDAPPDGKTFTIQVTDDGPGVSSEQLLHLTERHFRADAARSRRPGGLGLGLNIAFDVAERHGISLTFAHSRHGGLEVTFSGPR